MQKKTNKNNQQKNSGAVKENSKNQQKNKKNQDSAKKPYRKNFSKNRNGSA